MIVWTFAINFEEYRFLLTEVCAYRKAHPKVKSLDRIARFVLVKNYSTTFLPFLKACFLLFDDFKRYHDSGLL